MSDTKEISLKLRIEGVSNEAAELGKLEVMLKNINEERRKFLQKVSAKGIISNKDKLVIAAYDRSIKETSSSIKGLKKVIDSAPDSLNRMRQKLIEMKQEYANASKEAREKMIPTISKLNDEILKSERAIGVHQRNVGNYPDLLQGAAGGFRDLTSSVGGTTGAIGDAVSTVATATGPIGILTAGVAILAAAWKNAKENIELYLNSADKLKYGAAGFNPDASEAMDDAVKRARGGIIQVTRLEAEAKNRLLLMKNLTDEQREQLELQIKSGQEMQRDNRALLDNIGKNKDKGISLQKQLEWKQKYSALLKVEEELNDKGLENETRWEELEANLVKQRAIVSDQSSTILQKQEAAVEAERIAKELASEKLLFINQQIDNITAIAEMTGTQEVVEDRVNALLKERNTIQKEYYSDQIKINKLERATNPETGGGGDPNKPGYQDRIDSERRSAQDIQGVNKMKEFSAQYNEEQKAYQDFLDIKAQSDADYAKQKEKWANEEYEAKVRADKESEKNTQEHEDNVLKIKHAAAQGVQEGVQASFDFKRAKLRAEMEAELSNANLTETQRDAIKKKYAREQQKIDVKQALANGAAAITKNIAQLGFIAAIPINILTAIQTGIQVATIKAQKYETGGKINRGVPIYIPGSKDNLLIAVNNKEAVINEKQIAALGGTRAMQAARVPGFENGGYAGQYAPSIPPAVGLSIDYERMAEIMKNSIEVTLNTHKVISAIREVEVTTTHQRI